jgi:hypothetical protein
VVNASDALLVAIGGQSVESRSAASVVGGSTIKPEAATKLRIPLLRAHLHPPLSPHRSPASSHPFHAAPWGLAARSEVTSTVAAVADVMEEEALRLSSCTVVLGQCRGHGHVEPEEVVEALRTRLGV